MSGHKNDKGKPRIDLIPPAAILEVAEVLTDGVNEYGEHNWKEGIAYSRLYSAIQRHLLAFWSGEDVDGSGHRALAHACTDIMMLMEMSEKWDDRYVPESYDGMSTETFVEYHPVKYRGSNLPDGHAIKTYGDDHLLNGTFSVDARPTGE